jgi:hypothetical protein
MEPLCTLLLGIDIIDILSINKEAIKSRFIYKKHALDPNHYAIDANTLEARAIRGIAYKEVAY